MMATKKPAAKTKTVKATKPATVKSVKPEADVTLESLAARVEKLEGNDIVRMTKGCVCKGMRFVEGKYAENPALTIGVGVGILILLAILF